MKNKQIYARYGFTDLVTEDSKKVQKYVQVRDYETGEVIDEIQATLICFEDEDGEECNEDGSEL